MINKLCLGTAQFGSVPYGISNITGKVDDQTLKSILECCVESNIHTLDTASAYGDSQARIGKCSFYNWHIISKVPRLRGLESDQIKSTLISIVQKSLTDLHVDSLDTLLIHDSKDLASSSSDLIYTSLLELKEAGIVKSIGVSIYTPDDFYSISPDYKLDIVQAPWNVFDQSLCTSGLVDDLNRLNVKIHIRSIFLQGLLLMNPSDRPQSFTRWAQQFDHWDQFCFDNKFTRLEACVRASLSLPFVDKILFGVQSLTQLQQIIAYTDSNSFPQISQLAQSDLQLINPMLWQE